MVHLENDLSALVPVREGSLVHRANFLWRSAVVKPANCQVAHVKLQSFVIDGLDNVRCSMRLRQATLMSTNASIKDVCRDDLQIEPWISAQPRVLLAKSDKQLSH